LEARVSARQVEAQCFHAHSLLFLSQGIRQSSGLVPSANQEDAQGKYRGGKDS
jgi:methenyltetrahydromethanopterin cyclohydrolase